MSLQITHDPGWQATVDGERQPIRKDGLGFLVIEPRCEQGCTVALTYDGGPERTLTLLASLSAMLCVLGVGVFGKLRRLNYLKV